MHRDELLLRIYTRRQVVVVFTLHRSFYPTTSAVHPVSVLILHPREMQILWSQTTKKITNQRNPECLNAYPLLAAKIIPH